MFLPESLYLLSDRDRQVSWLEPVLYRAEATIAAVSVGLNYTVPDGRALILQNAFVYSGGGGAQTTTELEIALQFPAGGVGSYTYLDARSGITTQLAQLRWTGSVLVPEKWQVAHAGTFSAGAVGNLLVIGVTGILVPIGNILRV